MPTGEQVFSQEFFPFLTVHNEILYHRTPGAYTKYTETYGVTLLVCVE